MTILACHLVTQQSRWTNQVEAGDQLKPRAVLVELLSVALKHTVWRSEVLIKAYVHGSGPPGCLESCVFGSYLLLPKVTPLKKGW